jgi:16S rRNA processing protein RimM
LVEAPDVRWIALGVITGAHGLQGTLKVKTYNVDSELLFQLDEVALRAGEAGALRIHAIAEAQATAKGVLLRLDDVQSIEAAELLRGAELCVPRALLPALPEGEFYHVDLEGLAVFNTAGERVGAVERVHEYPASSVLFVQGEAGLWEVPMSEPYLVEIDLPGGRVVVDELDDLELQTKRAPK